MGESYNSDSINVPENHQNNSDQEMPSDDDTNHEEEDDHDLSPEEFSQIDKQLDALNSALDDIEQKNDDIHAKLLKLLELLQSNREIRKQMQDSQQNSATNQHQTNDK